MARTTLPRNLPAPEPEHFERSLRIMCHRLRGVRQRAARTIYIFRNVLRWQDIWLEYGSFGRSGCKRG
jgi:hypothetical protein